MPLGDGYAAKQQLGSIRPREGIGVGQRETELRAAARCADEYRDSRGGLDAFKPSTEIIRRVPVHAAVNDFRDLEIAKMLVSINFRIQSWQKRKWPWCRHPLPLVLNVINDQAVKR